jgi:DNA-binding transcriptional MerR regulator
MEQNEGLLKAGEFAKLARTTKRTVLWYDQQGVLKPAKVDNEGFRLYEPKQIIDFQVILLLKKLGLSLGEVKSYLGKKRSLEELFDFKKKAILGEIIYLQNTLKDIEGFYYNLKKRGVLVDPKVKIVRTFEIYYLLREGQYAQIGDYHNELRSKFINFPKEAVLLTVFMDAGYRPKKARMKIGVVKNRSLRLEPGAAEGVKQETIPGFKALTHKNYGSSKLLSLLWRELDKYVLSHGFKQNTQLPFEDMEIYHRISDKYTDEEGNYMAEIHLPIL